MKGYLFRIQNTSFAKYEYGLACHLFPIDA